MTEESLEEVPYKQTDEELRAERVDRARRQAQQFVRSCRDPAYIVSDGKRTDVIVFRRNCIELVDNKFTDNDTFYVEASDIEKGLEAAAKISARNMQAIVVIDMWFPRYRMRRCITIQESNRGHSLKIWIAGRRIMTAIV